MPALDRRIIVRRTVTARNQFGESVETTTDFPMWATRQDARQIDKAEAGGDVTLATRAYVIRYRAEIADAPHVASLSVIDGTITLDATNVTEATVRGERRKFLRIECTGEVA